MLAKKVFGNEQPDEKVLLTETVNGIYTAFTRLYELHAREVTKYAFKFTNDIQIITGIINHY